MFKDRKDAGEQLASMLERHKNSNALVMAFPGGGIEVGCVVARYLNLEFSPLIIRKLPCPHNPDTDFGVLTEDNGLIISEDASCLVPLHLLDWLVEENKRELEHDLQVYRKNKSLPDIADRTVILVNEVLIRGTLMRGAIQFCRRRNAGKIVVAVPVSEAEIADVLYKIADEVVITEKAYRIRNTAEAYRNWREISPTEMITYMDSLRGELVHQ